MHTSTQARSVRHLVNVTVAVLLAPAISASLLAQAPRDSADQAAVLRDSTAGLDWMLPGHRDWSRYIHPGQCVAAMKMVQMSAERRTNRNSPSAQDDTLLTAARTVGKACAAKFSVKNVSPHEWMAFHKLALLLDDLPLAHAIVESQLALASTPEDKGSVIVDALLNYSGRDPRHVAAADSLVERILTFGPEARWWRILALQVSPSSPAFDTTRWMTRQGQAEKEYKTLTHEERLKATLPGKYLSGNWFSIREYSHIAPAKLCPENKEGLLGLGPDTIRGNAASMFWAAIEANCQAEADVLGKPVGALGGGQWFKPGDTVGTTSLGYPIPGHVTLVVNDTLGAGRISKNLAIYERLFRKYNKQGLDIVLMHRRKGFAWGSGLLSAENETQLMRWYDHDYLKLPFPIAVYDSSATDMPGRLIIGRDGRQVAGTIGVDAFEPNEGALDAFIAQALDASVQRAAGQSAGADVR